MTAKRDVILYAYYLSSCSWRVRAVLTFKQIPYEERPVDVVKNNDHLTKEYQAINPAQKVPALAIDNEIIVESMAIIQYLEENHPKPALTPETSFLRAQMREIIETVVSGIQPLQNYGLKSHFETDEQFDKFTKYFTERGLETLEELLKKTSGKYCVGDQITLADVCVLPQLYNAVWKCKVDLSKYPTVSNIYKTLLKEKVFQETHPKYIKSKI